jgi:hypothetical protein
MSILLETVMTQVVVDAETRAKLHGLTQPLSLVDEHGHCLGQFVPASADSSTDSLEPDISMEELRRRAEHFQGKPLSHLLSEWEKRK